MDLRWKIIKIIKKVNKSKSVKFNLLHSSVLNLIIGKCYLELKFSLRITTVEVVEIFDKATF